MKKINLIIILIFLSISSFGQELKVSASSFSIQPIKGMIAGHSRVNVLVEEVYGDLKSTIFLFEDNGKRFLLVTSPLGVDGGLPQPIVEMAGKILNLTDEQIVTSSSHNHTIPSIIVNQTPLHNASDAQKLSQKVGKDFMEKLEKSLLKLEKNLVLADVEWGKAEENRISYNRRGVYPNGKTYFMREEDRQLVGEGYVGVIDPDVSVVVFKDSKTKKPISALTMFACHPVVAYNPEKQFSFGQFPQIMSEKVSEYFENIPVGFVQGTSGDINAKFMLTGTIEQAKQAGELLGETAIIAAKNLIPSKRKGMEFKSDVARIPYADLPSLPELKASLNEIDDFIKRGKAGDENTLSCVGMNFPKALTPPYRATLIMGVRDWYEWAIKQHEENKLYELPRNLPIRIFIARFGDVGFSVFPYEVFVKTGLKVKKETNLPIVLAGGYSNAGYGYIPDESATDDREYMSGYFRYRKTSPPYTGKAGDAAADLAIKNLNHFAQ
ncbi:hypothetical protein M3B46_03940 [Sphingobacterium daejeonense]|uniref:hypothetical protein n=1 Tax=Sphingobacterium daejeonense TaxID=371142 RepID=UPI0021A5B0FD|nr:hypothetical protein [Sphingobacterium daejeonense]MCT1530130.1 hypothetical protein [Sphingobacterium daejeonense]